ncbi:MAG: hypothetical protein LBD68_01635 [Zoogloeaceae bacterium]|jgi:uncharacterized membrane protein YfcA|nr:hypothetical protein [Zoogloeaceae bacterium]
METKTVAFIAALSPLLGAAIVRLSRRKISYRLALCLLIVATLLLIMCGFIGVWLVLRQDEGFTPWILACCSLVAFVNAIPSRKQTNHPHQPKADA